MKTLTIAVVLVLVVSTVGAATLVLKGGKQVDVQGFSLQGNLVVVKLADGRVSSYPVSAVDMAATSAANPVAPASAATAKDTGPRSPFAGAKAAEGSGALSVTDKDVAHNLPALEPEGEGDKGKEQPKGDGGVPNVTVVSYEKKLGDDGQWEVRVTLANSGGSTADGVGVTVRAVDDKGNDLGSASGSASGKLEAGQQTVVVMKMAPVTDGRQFMFDVRWQSIIPLPTPPAGASGGEVKGAATPVPAPAGAPTAIRYQAPPNTLMANPNAVGSGDPNQQVPLTAPPPPTPGT